MSATRQSSCLSLRLDEVIIGLHRKCHYRLQVDEQGQVLQSLHDPTGKHAFSISAVHEHDGKLYLGSLAAPYMLALSL